MRSRKQVIQYRREVRDEGKFQDSSYAASPYPVSSDESSRMEGALGGMSPKNKQKRKKKEIIEYLYI